MGCSSPAVCPQLSDSAVSPSPPLPLEGPAAAVGYSFSNHLQPFRDFVDQLLQLQNSVLSHRPMWILILDVSYTCLPLKT